MGTVASPGDLTARATIRNEALRLFAEHGPDAVTIRQIAAAAQVSPALVLHHFGNKDGLRAAVDDYASGVFDSLLDVTSAAEVAALLREGHGESIAAAFGHNLPPDSPLPAYLRRLLLSADPAGLRLFRRWHAATLLILNTMAKQGLLVQREDTRLRAALLLVNDLAMILLRDPIRDVLGFDPLTPQGLSRWAGEVAALYRDGLWRTDIPAGPTDTKQAGP